MPLNAQPPGRRGTVGHAYSPLNLRFGLALFGFAVCAVFAVVLMATGHALPAAVLAVLAAVAVVDLVVITLRRRARHRSEPGHHSAFE